MTKNAYFLQGGIIKRFDNVATVGEFCRAERAARMLARRLERGAAREAVRSQRRLALARRLDTGAGFLVKARARLSAHVAARRALEARRTADKVARRLARVEAALTRSHERQARRAGLVPSSMLDGLALA